MEPENTLQALLALWDELPTLLGRAWVELYPEVEALIVRLQSATDLGERALLTAELALKFRPYPQARQRLRQAVQEIDRHRGATTRLGGKGLESQTPAWPDLLTRARQLVNPPVVTRYTDIAAPRSLAVGRRGVITVGLTRAPAPESEQARPLEAQLGQFLTVYLHSLPQDFEIIGESVKRLPIEPETDTEPTVFYIKGLSLGRKELRLDFYQAGAPIGAVHLLVEVTKETLPEEQLQALTALMTAGGPYAPPPDLDIRVTTRVQEGQTTLEYVLHSPNGAVEFHHQPVKGEAIKGSPEAYQAHQMRKIEALADGRDIDGHPLTPQEVEDKLRAIGHLMYEELFSDEMRSAYRQFRDEAHSLQITSDEPWIPWELIRPYDGSDPRNIIDDDFMCARFQMTRWLAGRGGGAGKIQVRRAVCVEAAQGLPARPLPYAQEEQQHLADLAALTGVEDLSPNPATGSAVGALLDGGKIDLWHFAAHGNVSLDHPNESAIILADGRALRAEDIHGRRQTHIACDKPLVFLNACRVGQQGWSLTRLGGWAAAWVDRSRCGAFVGPLWSVNDRLAYEFARIFYDTLREGQTIGRAVQAARERVRSLAPDNPAWLAFSVYAHPNARVTFGNGQ